MWRQRSAARVLSDLLGPRRTSTTTRRFVSSSTAVLRVQHHPASASTEDDFFVDIDQLAGYGSANNNNAATATATTTMSSGDVLGVVRTTPEDEDARYSRLQVPLPPADPTASTGGTIATRSNTRAGLGLGEEARYADTSAVPLPSAPQGSTDPDVEKNADNREHCATTAVEQMPSGEGSESGRLPDPGSLPYDDERFAEMLLEMEVNGVIDETWQDAKKAHIEDVKELAEILTSLKVRDICCIDVSEKTSNFDYMMFGTCEGARHIHLAAWAAQDADKVHRISKIKRKQTDELWEVVPIGRIVLNLMVESFRDEMTLERKWAVTRSMDPLAAANAPISEGRQVKAHGLWTLTLNLQDLEDFEVDYCKDVLMRQV